MLMTYILEAVSIRQASLVGIADYKRRSIQKTACYGKPHLHFDTVNEVTNWDVVTKQPIPMLALLQTLTICFLY